MFGDLGQLVHMGPSISKLKEELDRRERAEKELARVEHKVMIYSDFIRSETAARDAVQKQLELGRDIESSHRLKGPDCAKKLAELAGYDWTITAAKETLEHWIGEVEKAKENVEKVKSDSYKPASASVSSSKVAESQSDADTEALIELGQAISDGRSDWVKKHGEPQPILRSGRW